MIVKQIISTKTNSGIISVKPSDTVAAAAAVLAENRIGAVVVTSDGAVAEGILSERDIVRGLAKTGSGCMDLQVLELMTSNVISCGPEETALAIMGRMSEGRFRHMPVIDEGTMIGVVSIGDVVKARLSEIQEENKALTGMISNEW